MSIRVVRTSSEIRRFSDDLRGAGLRTALVPTMGALHEGHLALVEEARKHADRVIVSIFVNPTQFGPNEDFDRYPRSLESDLEALETSGEVDAVFAPSVEDMYPDGARTVVHVQDLGDYLCGPFRPGHFDGVTTVVSRLLAVVRPDVAVFGKKDAQQFVILKRLAQDLGFGTEIVGVETIREADGLALSSRNRYLSDEARHQATVVSRAVFAVRDAVINDGERDPQVLVDHMLHEIERVPTASAQYAQLVDIETLAPLSSLESGQEILAAVAVYIDDVRLIDNQFITVP